MSHFVRVPKDLNDIKEKVVFGLTKRQLICFGIGLVVGLPMFFLTRNYLGLNGGIYAMGITAAPAIFCGIYKKNGIYFERQVKFMIEFFKRPKKRYYRTTNVFRCIENHIEYIRLKKKLSEAEKR